KRLSTASSIARPVGSIAARARSCPSAGADAVVEPGTDSPPQPDRPAPRCSIIIPVHNRASLTRQCLNALVAQRLPFPLAREVAGNGSGPVAYEIVVVDDASTDLTGELLAGYGERIRVVTRATNDGFARACNDGAAAARGAYLVFLNNDTIPRAGWLEALVRYADGHPAAAAVGSK